MLAKSQPANSLVRLQAKCHRDSVCTKIWGHWPYIVERLGIYHNIAQYIHDFQGIPYHRWPTLHRSWPVVHSRSESDIE